MTDTNTRTDQDQSESDSIDYETWLFEKALDTWGEEAQFILAIEEAAELQQALTGLYRGRINDDDVVDEIADLQIMLSQLALVFGKERVKEVRGEKLHRLEERLESVES